MTPTSVEMSVNWKATSVQVRIITAYIMQNNVNINIAKIGSLHGRDRNQDPAGDYLRNFRHDARDTISATSSNVARYYDHQCHIQTTCADGHQ